MKNSILILVVAAFAGGSLASAAEESSAGGALETFAGKLVLPTYEQLGERSGELVVAVEAAAETPSAETIEKARGAWVATREPWEVSEAFLFGPVDTEGHDPSLDSWPVNIADLEKVIDPETGPETLDGKSLGSLDEGTRGFHVVEYLLFADPEGNSVSAEQVATLLSEQPRRTAYLVAATKALDAQAKALLADYAPDGKDFVGQIATAGDGSKVYSTQAAALSEIGNAMAGIADESSQAKLLAPAEEGDVTLLESRFSKNTLTDVLNNIAGIQRASVIIKPVVKDPALQAELEKAIDKYQTSVEEIPASFNDDPAAAKSAVEKAAEAGAALRDLIEQKIVPEVKKA